MPRAGQDKQIRAGKQLMKLLRHTAIQIRVGSAKNNSDGPPKLLKLESCLRAGSYGWSKSSFKRKKAGLVRVGRLSPAQNQGSTIADRTFASPLIACYATTWAGGTL